MLPATQRKQHEAMFKYLKIFQEWVKPITAEFIATWMLVFWACMLQVKKNNTLVTGPCLIIAQNHVNDNFTALYRNFSSHRPSPSWHGLSASIFFFSVCPDSSPISQPFLSQARPTETFCNSRGYLQRKIPTLQ